MRWEEMRWDQAFMTAVVVGDSERSEPTLRRYVMVVDIVHLSTPVLQLRFLHGAEKGRSPQDAARVSYLCTLLPLWIGDVPVCDDKFLQ